MSYAMNTRNASRPHAPGGSRPDDGRRSGPWLRGHGAVVHEVAVSPLCGHARDDTEQAGGPPFRATLAIMPPVTLTQRRWLAVGLLLTAVLTVAVTVAANADGQGGFAWRCGESSYLCMSDKRGGHIYLRLLAHPFLGVILAAGLSFVAAHLAMTRRGPRVAAKTLAGVAALAALLIVGPFASYGGVLSESQQSVVATAQGFRLVSYRSPGYERSDFIRLRLQSREGLAS